MKQTPLYPLKFAPIYQYRLWGGRRLAHLLTAPLPGEGPIGEAWLLSDRDDHSSLVAEGPLAGSSIGQLFQGSQEAMMGQFAGCFPRFPLLLKFLDARDVLSVQVHPSDQQAGYLPEGELGKTEAWVVLEIGPERRIYAGLKRGETADNLLQAIADGTLPAHLACFRPVVDDGVLLPAGTVHSLADVVVFEVQENSDVTFRLFDWNRTDPETGQPRALQVDQAMACIDFDQGALAPVTEESEPGLRSRLFRCAHFTLWRIRAEAAFFVGMPEKPRILVCVSGQGQVEHEGVSYAIGKGDVVLLPAAVGVCHCVPLGAIVLLEIALPEKAQPDAMNRSAA